jgi:hypothetical protein
MMFGNFFTITPQKSELALNIIQSIPFKLNLIYQTEDWSLFSPYYMLKDDIFKLENAKYKHRNIHREV